MVDRAAAPAANQEWQERLAAVASEQEPGWEALYEPGSFGCHELLDRVMLLGDLVEGQVLEHPSCALHAEWHQLACASGGSVARVIPADWAEHLTLGCGGRQPN